MTAAAAIRRSRRGLAYGERGHGPAVLLVHGWCLDRTVWLYLEESLVRAGHRVITPALAGYGASSDLVAHRSLAEHGEDIADLLEELDAGQALLCGFAFGAGVILSLPDYKQVSTLVTIAIPSARTANYTKMGAAIMKDWPLFASRSAAAVLSQPQSDATLSWLGRMFEATPLDSALAGVEILSGFEPAEMTRTWDVPAVFVHGANDPIVPSSVSQDCARRFDGSYLEIPECGHLAVLDQKAAIADAIASFSAQQRN